MIIAEIQRITKIFIIFEPTTFQTAISGFHLRAAIIDVASSGILVPIATTVRPMMASDNQKNFAISTAPVTRIFYPINNTSTPPMIQRTALREEEIFSTVSLSSGIKLLCLTEYTIYTIATVNRIIPSIRLMELFKSPSRNLSLTITRNIKLVNITIGKSKNRVVRVSTIGYIHALIQRISATFAIFDPRTFPMAISVFQEVLARTETTSSGILVPTATIVSPMIACEIQNFFAMDTAPSTKTFPPKVRRTSQKMTAAIDNKMLM